MKLKYETETFVAFLPDHCVVVRLLPERLDCVLKPLMWQFSLVADPFLTQTNGKNNKKPGRAVSLSPSASLPLRNGKQLRPLAHHMVSGKKGQTFLSPFFFFCGSHVDQIIPAENKPPGLRRASCKKLIQDGSVFNGFNGAPPCL